MLLERDDTRQLCNGSKERQPDSMIADYTHASNYSTCSSNEKKRRESAISLKQPVPLKKQGKGAAERARSSRVHGGSTLVSLRREDHHAAD